MIRCGRGLQNETMILFCPKNVSCDWDKGSVNRCFLKKQGYLLSACSMITYRQKPG